MRLRCARRFFPLLIAGALLGAACSRVPYTGRLQLDLGDWEEKKEAGAETAREATLHKSIVTQGEEAQMVARVGERIARAAALPGEEGGEPAERFSWNFYLVRDSDANAFSLPDGSVFINTGLLEAVKSDDELAQILGHEAAHILAHHSAEQGDGEIVSSALKQVGSLALGLANLGQFGAVFSTTWSAGTRYGVFLPFSRAQEEEADYIGLVLATRAGYDPGAAPAFWRRMRERNGDAAIAQWRSTHPSDEARLEHLERVLPEMERYRPHAAAHADQKS